jgi:protein-tyrosine phosphatase
MKVLFVCTGNYYRSKFCENLWQFLLKKFDQKGTVSSSGFKPELALLWKEAFGNISPFTSRALSRIGVPVYDDSSLHLLNQDEIYNCDKIVLINRSEHMNLLKDSGLRVPLDKLVTWENGDVDQEFPIESIFLMMSNVCKMFQELYGVNTYDTLRSFRESFYRNSAAFSWRVKDLRN